MAAIDKLYVYDYTDYDDLRKWALAYYPKLLIFFYNTVWDWTDYEKSKKSWLKRTKGATEDEFSFPVMNTPFHVDRKLKWICPVPCVREYLHTQCGVNPKWEWLYKIFWRGKEYFMY